MATHFEASISSNKLMVINFSASWCGPCRYMESFINELAAKYAEVECIKMDIDELPGVSRDFAIQAMPTFVLLRGGKEVGEVVVAKKEMSCSGRLRSIELSAMYWSSGR